MDIYEVISSVPKVYGYIYKITNSVNGMIYVGQTKQNIYTRFRQHCKVNTVTHGILSDAIDKFGSDSFTIETIDIATSREQLDKKETYWIRKLGSFYPHGYNLNNGGKGTVVSEETRQKMRDAHLGKSLSETTKQKVSDALRKRKRTLKSHCKHGHLYDERNTYIRPDGCRDCKTCLKNRSIKHLKKKQQRGGK